MLRGSLGPAVCQRIYRPRTRRMHPAPHALGYRRFPLNSSSQAATHKKQQLGIFAFDTIGIQADQLKTNLHPPDIPRQTLAAHHRPHVLASRRHRAPPHPRRPVLSRRLTPTPTATAAITTTIVVAVRRPGPRHSAEARGGHRRGCARRGRLRLGLRPRARRRRRRLPRHSPCCGSAVGRDAIVGVQGRGRGFPRGRWTRTHCSRCCARPSPAGGPCWCRCSRGGWGG